MTNFLFLHSFDSKYMEIYGEGGEIHKNEKALCIIAECATYVNYYLHLGIDGRMNLGGIKISSVTLENAILKHLLLSISLI